MTLVYGAIVGSLFGFLESLLTFGTGIQARSPGRSESSVLAECWVVAPDSHGMPYSRAVYRGPHKLLNTVAGRDELYALGYVR